MQKKGGGSGAGSTQSFLAISEIKDDVIVTRDGGVRAVIAVSSTNFILKSQDEQNAILARYQSFLNGLDFPIQVLIQSRKLDIHGYLEKVRQIMSRQSNELLRIQTEEYIQYIEKLLEFGNIMNKMFYVIIPFSSGSPVQSGFFSTLKNLINPSAKLAANQARLTEQLSVIDERVARVESGLSGLGLRTMRLATQELIELLYNSYNIGHAQTGLINLSQLNYLANNKPEN